MRAGRRAALSFAVPAKIPSGTNTNSVHADRAEFFVGNGGVQCLSRDRIRGAVCGSRTSVAVAATFTDAGATATLQGPPDANYDHANFYWRLELQPEVAVSIHSATTIGNSTLGMLTNDFTGGVARITRGTGATQERAVIANDATTLTVTPPWTMEPDSTSFFVVAEATWKFGGLSATSPAQIEVPNQTGATVEISGRSANVLDQESAPN